MAETTTRRTVTLDRQTREEMEVYAYDARAMTRDAGFDDTVETERSERPAAFPRWAGRGR